jgi:uncharacterized membrane protein
MIPIADILVAFKWLLAIYLCGLVGVLFIVKDGPLKELKYLFGKAMGIIGLAAITWLMSVFNIMPFTPVNILILVVVLCVVAIVLRSKQIKQAVLKNWRDYLFLEAVFIALFAAGIAIRSSIPTINGVEKFMDVSILSNLMRHTKGVPVDTWYAPYGINYYYFGHWVIAMLAKISGTAVGYAFNLGFATVLAISGSAFFGLGRQLSKKYIGGLLTVFMVFFAGNLQTFCVMVSGAKDYFFYSSGRFIDQVINEYPLYSVVLGDLHAHILNLMICTTLDLALLIILLEKKFNIQRNFAIAAGVVTGLIFMASSFDLATSFLLFGLVLLWLLWRKKILLKNAVILAISFVLPFLFVVIAFSIHFKPPVSGIGIALFQTPLKHVFWQFGAFFILLITALGVLYKDRIKPGLSKNVEICLIFVVIACALILLSETIFIKDIFYFQNPPYARANTVFKMWYAAWPLLAIGSSVLMVIAIGKLKKLWRLIVFAVLVIVVGMVMSGTYQGLKVLNDRLPNTLNGLDYLKSTMPEKLAVLKWANENIKGQPVVIQAPGESYSEQSWFASYSGIPTYVGWQTHEWQWRYSPTAWTQISERTGKLKTMYQATSVTELTNNAAELGADYILIGPDERTAYSINDSLFLAAFGQPIYSNFKYQIYVTNL